MEDIQAQPSPEVSGSKTKRRIVNLLKVILPILFFGYLFWISMNFPLNDPDLFWHLKTGQYILTTRSLPDEDPFCYTTPIPLAKGQKTALKAQWLGEVILYASFSIGDYKGVTILRNILVILPMLILYLWLVEKGIKPWTAIIMVSLASLMLTIQLFYSFERPQGISFYCSIVVVMLIERLRQHAKTGHLTNLPSFDVSYVILPLVMVLWSNIHAGYMVGNIIIIIYMFSEASALIYRKLRGREQNSPYIKALFIVGIISILASFLNPATYKLFVGYTTGLISMFLKGLIQRVSPSEGGGWVENVVLEYKTLWYFYKNLGYTWLTFYWIFIGVLYLLMIFKYWQRKSIDLAELLTVSLITLFANYYARGLMFSLAIHPFYMAKTVYEIRDSAVRFKILSKSTVAFILILSIGFSTYTYKRTPYIFKPAVTHTWITPWYPTRLVEFLYATNIPGPMYNFYTWGGFLIWALYPQYKVFIDGRALDDTVNRTADAILKGFPGWKNNLDAYGINFIVIPLIFRESGHIIPLAVELVDDNDWKLIFIRNNSALFLRNTPQNEKIIKTFEIDKKYIYLHIIEVENIFLSGAPEHPVYNLAKADALFALKRYQEARAIYERFPHEGAHKLQQIKALGY